MTPTKSIVSFPLFLLLVTLSISRAGAEDAVMVTPSPPVIAASSHILLDFNAGKVLAENHADSKLAPASLTKILTVYVVFNEIKNGHLKLDDLGDYQPECLANWRL